MDISVELEKPSAILRKLKIRVPANIVANRFERGLAEVQKTAKLKGFRPGQVPISIVKQYYGEDVRHRVYHRLIDESFDEALRAHQLRAVGSPKIESPEHKTGEGDHDHAINEEKDFTYTATVEVLPELEVKGYTGIALKRENVDVKDEDVKKVIDQLLDSNAQLVPVAGGLAKADGSMSSRPAQKGDHCDVSFDGGLVTEQGIERQEGMKGTRVIELGSNSLIPGFEEEIIGMRGGDTKTFRLKFPADYFEKSFADKEAEFTVTLNEVKEKKLPELDDEFAKQFGAENVADLKKKIHQNLLMDRTREVEHKLNSDLLSQIIEKNPFDVPGALVETQTRALAQEWAQDLKRQGFNDQMIQEAIGSELENLKKRAESQVRASLLLEAIAKKENISVAPEDMTKEYASMATNAKVDEARVREFYEQNQGRKDDLEFRLRQDRTVKFLLDKAKIKSGS